MRLSIIMMKIGWRARMSKSSLTRVQMIEIVNQKRMIHLELGKLDSGRDQSQLRSGMMMTKYSREGHKMVINQL
jgi:hypothetical protein